MPHWNVWGARKEHGLEKEMRSQEEFRAHVTLFVAYMDCEVNSDLAEAKEKVGSSAIAP